MLYARGLKLRVTRGPRETKSKVSRVSFKKVKKLPSNFQLKTKNRRIVYEFLKTAEFLDVRGPSV